MDDDISEISLKVAESEWSKVAYLSFTGRTNTGPGRPEKGTPLLRVVEETKGQEVESALERHPTLDELAREGARRILADALEEEVEAYLAKYRRERDENVHVLVVRNGKARPRKMTFGAGTVTVTAPRTSGRREVKHLVLVLPGALRKGPRLVAAGGGVNYVRVVQPPGRLVIDLVLEEMPLGALQ